MKPARAKRARNRQWKPPCERPRVMKGLRALVYADAAGKKSDAFFIRQALPVEVQAALSLCEYLGRFGDLRARPYQQGCFRRSVRPLPTVTDALYPKELDGQPGLDAWRPVGPKVELVVVERREDGSPVFDVDALWCPVCRLMYPRNETLTCEDGHMLVGA